MHGSLTLLFMQGTHYMEMEVQTPTKRYPCLTFLHGVDRTVVLSCFQVDSRPDGCRCRGSLCISIGPTTRLFLYRCTYTINCNLQGHLFKKINCKDTSQSYTAYSSYSAHIMFSSMVVLCVLTLTVHNETNGGHNGLLARVAAGDTTPAGMFVSHRYALNLRARTL